MTTSIVTSMYNKKKEVLDTIENLFLPSLINQASSDKEVILVDDSSPLEKETRELIQRNLEGLSKFGNVVFTRNGQNGGFASAFNQGISLASGKSLVITNDDIYFPEGSVEKLSKDSQSFGIVGPVTNDPYVRSYQYCKQAPRIKDYSLEELEKVERFSSKLAERMKGQRIPTDFVSGFCIAIKSDLMRELGGFDEAFCNGYGEDTDLVKRIIQEGKSVVINPEVFIYHGGLKGSNQSMFQRPAKTIYHAVRNQIHLSRKWEEGFFSMVGLKLVQGLYRSTGRDTISELLEDDFGK